jgi:hypothetical protein
MPGDVGLVAGLLHRLIDLFVNEDQLPEIRKRRQLAALRRAADEALAKRDLAEHARILDEFRRLSDQP